jgi:hypothetical protein
VFSCVLLRVDVRAKVFLASGYSIFMDFRETHKVLELSEYPDNF